MKKQNFLILLLLVNTLVLAQKKEKIKGSNIVTIEQREIGNFDSIEVSDNIEVYLHRGEKSELKIEADDILHSIISIDLLGNTLRLTTSKTAYRYKKLSVRVTYTKDLKMITAKDDSKINAIQEIQLNDITINALDNSEFNLNVNTTNFILKSDDKSKAELNLKSENATFQISKKATLKALVSSLNLKCDLYEKSIATLEGDITNANIRLDNNSELTAKNLVIKNIDLLTESYSKGSVNSNTNITIDASGNSEILLYGDPKIEIKRFVDSASINKQPSK
ncbi:GIN domain-containing protein [Flavobacterium cellulosilyticum]|uniref:DUF2807 domain-containing protein n=1 Tax=Flavobacterium cellulosilyticum TaxID=2541731 RepID=A0A4R5CBF1_9FLAO|nr:DUF2807 domain-containing protein [Flavobacterium cellulosilyticum]TDD97281.1 DUF2807 domain-containing protein [Flavobacterium cellulosilyticum]